MDVWREVRLKARAAHLAALEKNGGNYVAAELIRGALEVDDLQLAPYEPGSIVSVGVLGFLDRASKIVNIANGQGAAEKAVVIAHEIGHFRLHKDPRNEVTAVAHGLGGDPIDSGAGRVEGYSPRERKEVQADVFAGEFLCPSDWLRSEIVDKGRKPSDIASELGLPNSLVTNQTVRALLLPPLRPSPDAEEGVIYELDPSQREAALWDQGPLLVDAGPGTGKTRTLVHRVLHLLLVKKVSPASILALTFSNKAAEEMRERIAADNVDASIEMWTGTFHAFGLELVTKYPGRIKRTGNVRILDEAGQLALLEDNLTRLPLYHFQNLYEPAYELVHVLRAISRCKDELISPDLYHAEAKAAKAAARSEEENEAADKALEIAAIYRIYEEELEKADAVDFGDLVLHATNLLNDNPDIRAEYHARFDHILVDEFQDVNLASARLLKALCKAQADIWVVADQRQSIYRFRGAAPSNVQQFTTEFSGQQRSLGVNYRSGAPVVRSFQTFARTMRSAPGGSSWVPNRGQVGAVSQIQAPTVVEEATAVRDHIEEMRAQGIAYRDQVILARSHLTLARVTSVLEQLGVPLLYLGDLFERAEIRDLLSLLSIDAEPGAVGLVRVAQLSEYNASKADALAVIAWAASQDISVFEALRRTDEIKDVSEHGKVGLGLLGFHLRDMGPHTSPWVLLTTWLFERSSYLSKMLVANHAQAQQKLIAIYQILKVCGEAAEAGINKRKQFLARIRRIEALDDDRVYRAISSEASDMDGVRVMTIHGSKGLEFKAVHLPALATRYMPSSRQGTRCPPPPTLPQLARSSDEHDAEEECLFFVALSRAQDYLFLSRAERYSAAQSASPSKFLASINGLAPARRCASSGLPPPNAPIMVPLATRSRYEERELSLYLQCARRYQSEAVDGLRVFRDDSPYLNFHRCVFRTIAWLGSQRTSGTAITREMALAHLREEWTARGPNGHGFEPYYRASAEAMVERMADITNSEVGQYDTDEWSIDFAGKTITLTPDRVLIEPDGRVRVQRVRTGRRSKSEADNRIYALLRHGAGARYPGTTISIETLYLATREIVPVMARNDQKLLDEYADAIGAIEQGIFGTKPNDTRGCPNCQCYFTCDFVNGIAS